MKILVLSCEDCGDRFAFCVEKENAVEIRLSTVIRYALLSEWKHGYPPPYLWKLPSKAIYM